MEQKSEHISLRVPPRVADKLAIEAAARDVRVSELLRHLITTWLRNPDSVEFGMPLEHQDMRQAA